MEPLPQPRLPPPHIFDNETTAQINQINSDLFLSYKQIINDQHNLLLQYQMHYDKLYRKYINLKQVKHHRLKIQYSDIKNELARLQDIYRDVPLDLKSKYDTIKQKYRDDIQKLTSQNMTLLNNLNKEAEQAQSALVSNSLQENRLEKGTQMKL